MIVQAYSQIYHLYGEQDGRSIIAGCGNQIYLLTIEANTAKEFSACAFFLVGSPIATFADSIDAVKVLNQHQFESHSVGGD
jgi:hypothetical protein